MTEAEHRELGQRCLTANIEAFAFRDVAKAIRGIPITLATSPERFGILKGLQQAMDNQSEAAQELYRELVKEHAGKRPCPDGCALKGLGG